MWELEAEAQQQFQRRFRRFAFGGRQLDSSTALGEVGVQDGDRIDAIVHLVQLASTERAFALHAAGGAVLTWGNAVCGGDSSQVREQLVRVQQIQATRGAFAAILHDGSVVTWGHSGYGGNNSQVREQLGRVQPIQAAVSAFFAAILSMTSALSWGRPDVASDGNQVQSVRVQQIQATQRAVAAILEDGSVVTWGASDRGGDSSRVESSWCGCSRSKRLLALLLPSCPTALW